MQRTLLLVDDEEDISAALARLLRPDGYTILRARSGKEGLELLAQHHEVGVIVSDQRMPEMTGVEFLSRAKELYPKTVRMVLSGYADLNSVTEAINRGAIYKFLTKPWNNDTLCANVLEAFTHHELVLKKERLMQEIQSANDLLAQVNLEWAAAAEQRDRQIERISHYDSLTGLPNRSLFLDRLEQELAHAQRDERLAAVIFINLDRFKQVNDSFGHPVGDQLLQTVAERLSGQMRAGDTVARMEGDEFGFVLAGLRDVRDASEVAQKVLDDLAHNAISVGNDEVYVTASIGISIYPFDGMGSSALMKNADAALHHAKSEGKSNFQYYTAEMNASAWQRLKLETDLRRALAREEFVLHYQPKVDLASGGIIGMEALLRWQSPERGLVAPGEFIPLLEETGLILPVGEWVLRAACKQARAWQQLGLPAFRIAVNLSALQFRQPDLAGVILDIFRECGLDPRLGTLEMELTESLLMKNTERTIATLNRLHELGIQFSIDDFGTGYSSLSYLKRFPISSLKIDQSFVRNLPHNHDDAAIVGAIIALGHSLGLKVIAEGVETIEQLDYLRTMKCDEMQGYLFSRPVPAEKMTQLLQSGAGLDMVTET
ncbi:MAG: diguanylate cyclase [Gallionellales bacterium RBG_16_57_15]|nr:MAG: diguanylate cyclase [Gallionellales bacterium RBG_16_57_15]